MSVPVILVTKIDHDSWWGYYINDTLYGYNDYYNFSDDEVKKEAVLRAIDEGVLRNRKDPYELRFEHHHDWPEYTDASSEAALEEFDSHLPPTLTELKQWFRDHA